MGRLMIAGMPLPEGGYDWCAACCVLVKGLIFADDATARRAQEGLADAGRELVVVAPPEKLQVRKHLQEAVTWAPSPVVGGGIPVPLCWSHLPAVDGSAPPPGQDPPSPPLFRGGS